MPSWFSPSCVTVLQWSAAWLPKQGANHETCGSQAKRPKSNNRFVPVQKEEGYDRPCRPRYHGQISTQQVRSGPVQASDHRCERTSQENGTSNVQVQIHSAGRCVVQTPKHEERTDKEVGDAIDKNLSTGVQGSLLEKPPEREDHVLGDDGTPAEKVRTVYRHRCR